jgi:Transposase DDE domain group 1
MMDLLKIQSRWAEEALGVRLSQPWRRAAVRFDEENLVSCAGLVPVMQLAEDTGLHELVADAVRIDDPPIPSTGVNPAGKVASIVAGMAAGADSIEDLDVLRHGGMGELFGEVYAPSTLGSFLRAFSWGHTRQLAAAARDWLVRLAGSTPVLAGADQMAYVDIDSLLRRAYGKHKQGTRFGHAKVGGYDVLLRGLSPLVATVSTPLATPVVAATRLRNGAASSVKGAASLLAEALSTAQAAGATGPVLVRADSQFYAGKVVSAAHRAGAMVSITVGHSPARQRAIAGIREDQWQPVHYPEAVVDPDTGELISDAEVAETGYTAFAGARHEYPARLVVRRVRDKNSQDGLFPVWRYHAFFTDTKLSTVDADLTHRQHAVVETVFADLIDGPLAHLPSGRFAANAAWLICVGMAHNLLRAAGCLAGRFPAKARGTTLRKHLVLVPARLARPQHKPTLHLPAYWPWQQAWTNLHTAATRLPATA